MFMSSGDTDDTHVSDPSVSLCFYNIIRILYYLHEMRRIEGVIDATNDETI
jgi:hypothetical protein